MNPLRNKQKLFQEYCKLKNKFVTSISSESESNDLKKIHEEILDETWAEWIQNYETLDHKSNSVETLVQEMSRIIEDCSNRANDFKI